MRGGRTGEKLRIGVYMYTPIVGGAEMYFKNLIWSLDRNRFEVTVFFEAWPEFEEFLDLKHMPEARVRRVAVREPGRKYTKRELPSQKDAGGTRRSWKSRARGLAQGDTFAAKTIRTLGWAALRYWYMMPNFIELRRAFREYEVDLLHVINGGYPGSQSGQLAPIAARSAGVRHNLMSVCNTPQPQTFPRMAERYLDRLVRQSVTQFLVPTSNLKEALVERGSFADEQVGIIPYGVLDPLESAQNDTGTEDMANPVRQVTMIAAFLPHKGQRYLVDAFAEIRKEFDGLRLVLVGEGPTKGAIEQHVRALGLDGAVEFPGFIPIDETLKVIARSELIAHPSDLEGVPYVILHAMSLSKAVVATRVGGIQEIIVPGETGILIAPRDQEGLRRELRRLLRDPAQSRAMGAKARLRYEKLYSVRSMVRSHETLYEQIASRD